MKKISNALSLILITTLFIATSTACTPAPQPYTKTGFYLDTIISITLYNPKSASLIDECFALIKHYENLFSKTIPTSDIARINQSAHANVKVDPETILLLEKAIYYAELSNGLVDPTVGSIVNLWDFKSNNGQIPDIDSLTLATTHVNYKNVVIDRTSQTVALKNPETQIDLGFIAKGYIADKLKEFLSENNVVNAIINLGGDISVIGSKPDKTPYNIGVQEPFAPSGQTSFVIPVTDRAIATTGCYERFFYQNDTLYHHILDPRTGFPIDNDLLSVTVIALKAADADALSTLCYILGIEEARNLIASLDGVTAVFLTKDNQRIDI